MFTILGVDGKEYGPVAASKIQEWIIGGRANLQTKARRAEETEWRTLGDYPEFSGLPAPAPSLTVAPMVGFTAPATATLVLASRWARLGAIVIDTIIGGLFALPGLVLLGMTGAFTGANAEPNPVLLLAGFATCGIGVLILLAIQIFLLVKYGQTIGKKLLNIKIVTFDTEELPGFVKVFLLRVLVNGLIGCVPFLGSVYTLVDACFIFREDKRCIHDLIAGTKVVRA